MFLIPYEGTYQYALYGFYHHLGVAASKPAKKKINQQAIAPEKCNLSQLNDL